MVHHAFRKAAILIGFFVLLLPLWREEANVPLFMAVIGLALLGLIVAEVLTGSVVRAETFMLAGQYPKARKEIKGTLFPKLLQKKLKKRYYAVQGILAAQGGKHELATSHLHAAMEHGLRGNRLAYTCMQLIIYKKKKLDPSRISNIQKNIQAIVEQEQDKKQLQKKINDILLIESL